MKLNRKFLGVTSVIALVSVALAVTIFLPKLNGNQGDSEEIICTQGDNVQDKDTQEPDEDIGEDYESDAEEVDDEEEYENEVKEEIKESDLKDKVNNQGKKSVDNPKKSVEVPQKNEGKI